MAEPRAGRLLIVDDEVELKNALCETLADEGFKTVGAASGAEALQALARQEFDLLLSDLMMPGMDGIQLLRQALDVDPHLVGIIMTGQGTIPTAVEAMKVGAFDYVLKPFNLHTMLPILTRALEVRGLRRENLRLRQYVERLSYESPRYQMIGAGPAMRRVVELVEKVAPTDATVLVRGPSGTGKELVARAIHFNSRRRQRPLVTINCAALQEPLLESELFGHEKGAFTGATQAKTGLVEVAEGGTLFIDEIGEMAAGLQAKLLRVLEDGHFRRVGSVHEHVADVRVVAATNRALDEEIKKGRFREDLFYRLNVVTIDLPPLRERQGDVPLLVEHFLASRQVSGQRFDIEPAALKVLCEYAWPGNIRELANVLERAQILAENRTITLDDLPEAIAFATPAPQASDAGGEASTRLLDIEQRHLKDVLRREKGNKVHAAKALGISRRALYRLISKHGLEARDQDAGTNQAGS